jgi:hypothetical protein
MAQLKSPEEIIRKYDENCRQVMEDVTLKREYQADMLNEFYRAAREEIQNEIDREREDLEVALRTTRRVAFQCPDIPGNKDKAVALQMYDHHMQKVWEMDSVQELDRYLQKQLLIDNPVGIKAVLTRAFELRASEMVGKVLAEYPEWEEAYMAFVEASEDLRDYSRSPHAFFGAGRLRTPREYLA